MEIVYLVLFFLAPGLIEKALEQRDSVIGNHSVKSGTIYEQLMKIVAYSVIISTLNIMLIWCIHRLYNVEFPKTLTEFIDCMDNMKIFFVYIIMMVVITVIFEKIIHYKVSPFLFKRRNKKLETEHGVVKMSPNGVSVWEDIFLNKERNEALIISIYKDGQYITSGFLESWNIGMDEPKEFHIVRSTEIERVLATDKDKDKEDKLLGYVDFEYFDFESGILVKIYDSDKTLEHWDDI